jgi:DNA-directed RNA polymerase I, II, and III subunit RPABC2
MPPKNLKSFKEEKEVKKDSEVKKDTKEKDMKDMKETKETKEVKEKDTQAVEPKNLSHMSSDAYDFYKNYDTSKNKMDPILNQYERASVIGIRAQQISEGAIPMIDVPEGIESAIEIATMELKMKKMPLIICREGLEYWRVCDLVDLENE